jgi:threonine synthase
LTQQKNGQENPTPESPGDGASMSLLDGASSNEPFIASELADQNKLAADPNQPLERRIEALEDIIDSEVGDTTMSRARNIERQNNLRQIFLKFEGGNPTGTQKDRIAFAHAMDAVRRGFDAITGATCGNYGAALALAGSMAGLRVIIHIPAGFHTKRVQEMINLGAEIIRVPGNYEDSVDASMEYADKMEVYDTNPGGANTALQLQAYGQIAYEIYDELRDAPLAVAMPVSNGTTLAGVYRGFLSLHRRGKTSRIPRMVAGSSHNKNPIVTSFLKGKDHCEDLTPDRIKETVVNEPLINWHSIDGDQALEAVRATNGWASNASDKTMRGYSRLVREQEGLNVLPASTAGLAVLLERHQKNPLPGDRYVVIFTGRR